MPEKDSHKGETWQEHAPSDKESSLWNMHLKTIYWWTSTQASEKEAYIIVYNGGVWPRIKTSRVGYLKFRAVKNYEEKTR